MNCSMTVDSMCVFTGVDSSVQTDRLLQEGLAEAEAWGDPDTQALLLLHEALLNTHCGKAPEESASILQVTCYITNKLNP